MKYNIRARFLADQGAIKNVLAVENDVVPSDGTDVLEQGCINAFLGNSPRSPRPRDLLGLPIGFETERVCLGVYNNGRLFRTEPCRSPALILACIVYWQAREISRIAPAPDFPFDYKP